MKRILLTLVIFAVALTHIDLHAQDRPFWNEIRRFHQIDSTVKHPRRPIVFTGSSSFTMWKTAAEDFPGHKVINRGFGGSSLPHVLLYADDVIFRYRPKQVVIYCGENDLAASDTVTGERVFQRFVDLFTIIRRELPRASVVFISIKPSPSRWHLKDKMLTANRLIKEFLDGQKRTSYVNVWDAMLGENGQPREELFLADRLHMTAEGYAIWKRLIEPELR